MFPNVVSIFNRVEVADDEYYLKTVLSGVLFVLDNATNIKDFDMVSIPVAKLYIPKNKVLTEGKKYIDPFEYKRLSDEERSLYFTLNSEDYFSKGDITLEDLTPSQYKNNFGNMYIIKGVTDYAFGSLKSWYVIGS